MSSLDLAEIVQALFAGDRGLLAMDESVETCNKRFAEVGIAPTLENRHAYRDWIIRTPKLNEAIGGAILFDETIRQTSADGTSFCQLAAAAGIIPGIKVDLGAKPLALHPEEKVTEGLDGLRDRLKSYAEMGARFAKWRAVIAIGKDTPSFGCIEANAHALARYAALCQECDLVPIVEPEVLMDGLHSLEQCAEVTEKVLHEVFGQLNHQHVALEGMILKPNMILPGLNCPLQQSVEEIADATVNSLLLSVPSEVPAIAFLSGGQPADFASLRLSVMNQNHRPRLPWILSFSYSRAILQHALQIWKADPANIPKAQQALFDCASQNRLARRGEYDPPLDAD
jgi:fructose-bisphosphate aldolase class I